MLLSSERPFVGASAFCIPGATLLRRNGLTQAVLPESDWNMANGQLRFPRNLGEPCSLLGESRNGDTGLPTPGLDGSLVRQGAKTTSETEVPPSEGNEVRRNGSRAS
jgi:hypothetical protein